MDKYHVDILDTDQYKFTMQNGICKLYPRVQAQYNFKNRDNREFPDGFGKRLTEIIDSFRDIRLTNDGYDYLRNKEKFYYLDPVYIDFLRAYRYDPKEVTIKQEGPDLWVKINGLWHRTVLWEVPLMGTISELYFEMTGQKSLPEDDLQLNDIKKATDLAEINVYYSEFGTRRRYSFKNQDRVVRLLKEYGQGHFLGTSNVYLSMKHNLLSMGTVAHEWYQAHAAMFGYKQANIMANEAWVKVYEGNLGTSLPDTFTTDVFLRSFNTVFAKLFDGDRQDSEKPLVFMEKIVAHYKKLRINPMHKYILFSDNLKSIEAIREIHQACLNRIPDRYGIGTWFSNDVGVKALNMVIKLTSCNYAGEWVPTVKLSDDPGKHNGDVDEVELCKKVLGIK